MKTPKYNETICQRCANARRSRSGYVEACNANPTDNSPINTYGRVSEAVVSGQCSEFCPLQGKKPA